MNSEDTSAGSQVLAILELLADEAPTRSFEDLLREARERSPDEVRLPDLERAVRIALDIRTRTEQRRRRQSALAALVDVLQDMTFQEALDGRLSVVTRHARRLLDFDMAYVSLRLPGGGSYVHKSDGDTTALNVGLEMGPGQGLGDMAQERGAPFWTPDYLNDDRFPHSDAIDEVVLSEGLHAILAVPMTYDGRTVGALYGASRAVRHFSPDEVSLLCSLADLSASVIDATRRMDRVRAELDRERAENSRIGAALSESRSLAEVQAALSGMCLEGADLYDIIRLAATTLGADLMVRNAHGLVLACTGEVPDVDTATLVGAMVGSHASTSVVELAGNLWAAHVTTGVEGPGVLICSSPGPLSDEGRRLLYFTAQTVAMALLLRHNLAAAAGPARDEYLNDLLSGVLQPPRHLAERARRLGLDPTAPHVVVTLRPEGGKQGEAAIWASSYAYRLSGLKTLRGECVVLFLPGSDPSAAARAAADELSPLLGHAVSAGAAGPVRNLASVGKTYREALRCLDTLVALGGVGGTAAAGDLGFLGLLLSDDHDVGAFIASAVGPVIEYDAQRSTDLLRTLDAYFASGGSPTHAAQDLHVHTNTVARRLERVTELLGPDWQQPATALEIQLALRLQRARHSVYRPGTSRPPAAQADRCA
ncbi:helix-turn-helix domain-containing protein [Streptomyces sp. NPDC088341]|uniref:helix-turn-helix domain-containing protein n=1 Tax=Streptomyces sp. NPDC088341 TaxID=3154870 RepID=UPI0034408D2D